MRDLIDAFRFDADAWVPRGVVVGEYGVLQIVAGQIGLLRALLRGRAMRRGAQDPGADNQRGNREHRENSKDHRSEPARARKIASQSSRTAPKPPHEAATQ